MADILIRGMEMPKNCGTCPLRASCVHRIYLERRPDYCPLVPVPPHGRLIDADELRSEYKEPMDWLDRTQVMYHVTGIWASIDAAPTIIPANPPKEET